MVPKWLRGVLNRSQKAPSNAYAMTQVSQTRAVSRRSSARFASRRVADLARRAAGCSTPEGASMTNADPRSPPSIAPPSFLSCSISLSPWLQFPVFCQKPGINCAPGAFSQPPEHLSSSTISIPLRMARVCMGNRTSPKDTPLRWNGGECARKENLLQPQRISLSFRPSSPGKMGFPPPGNETRV